MMKKLGRFRRDSDEVTTALHTDEFVRSDDVTALESELALLRRAVDESETALAALADCINQELRESGEFGSQVSDYLQADLRPYIRHLVDLNRQKLIKEQADERQQHR